MKTKSKLKVGDEVKRERMIRSRVARSEVERTILHWTSNIEGEWWRH